MKHIIFTPNAPEPIGPYSQAVRIGNTVYLSGQVAIDPSNNTFINGNIEEQTTLVLSNMEAVLEAAGCTFNNVVKCSIFLSDMGEFQAMNAIYATKFEHDPPARETVQVSELPKGAKVEISAIAELF